MNFPPMPERPPSFLPIELMPFQSATTTPEAAVLATNIARDVRIVNTFHSFLKKMTVRATSNMVVLKLEAEVLDRESCTPKKIFFERRIDAIIGTIEERYVTHQIVDFLHWTTQHEIDECITIRGARVNDPHRNEGTVEHDKTA